ncbi:MAG TPA: YbhB/YbcL family Raf kinase inhibitor-like protein [Trebonia sp.]|nr:YbhB/YbcL family Raf kinase inhibitor-like protein [Trebonia sp.]
MIRIGRRALASAIAIGAVLPTAGCGVLGPGADNQTLAAMTVSTAAFTQSVMPASYTCAAGAKAASPPLGWAGVPAGTKSLAIVMDDKDTPITPYIYWIVFDINPTTSEILQGQLPPGSLQARNSAGAIGYEPPCPGPQGHTYRFTVYALDKQLNLPAGTSLESAWTAIAAATIGMGRTTASATTPASAPSSLTSASASASAAP